MNELSPSTAGFRLIRLTKPLMIPRRRSELLCNWTLTHRVLPGIELKLAYFSHAGAIDIRQTPGATHESATLVSFGPGGGGGDGRLPAWDLLLSGKNYATR